MTKQNVLVVEDEELMRSILRQLLERAGYQVFTASSAETALEIFPRKRYRHHPDGHKNGRNGRARAAR